MNAKDLNFIKSFTSEEIEKTSDPELIYRLLGIVESLSSNLSDSKVLVQSLRDELNRLKGEIGKPNIRKNSKKSEDYSSEENRKRKKDSKSKGRTEKNNRIKIDREVICKVDKETLPDDARFNGYNTAIVQDLVIKTDNIRFKMEMYYSPSLDKTFGAKRPPGYETEFGPGIRSLIFGMKYSCNVSEKPIKEFLNHHNIIISSSTISRYLTKNLDIFHDEKDEIVLSGLNSTTYQQMDDTGARVNGRQCYTQILCNPYYTSYHTTAHKNRLSILQLILGPNNLQYQFNDEAFELLKTFKLSAQIVSYLRNNCAGSILNENELNEILVNIPTKSKAPETLWKRIKEAASIAWYHNQNFWPVIDTLLTDDAKQFDHIGQKHALCWIHAGRGLKKLNPLNPAFQEILGQKLDEFWNYYHILAEYKENPDESQIEVFQNKFDEIFSVETHYQVLDDRLKSIFNNKEKLLRVLWNPQLPLHNNESELGARVQVRKRDVSLHTITPEGTKAVDTFLTLKETTRKLGINFFEYLRDRLTRKNDIDRLGNIILQKAG